MAAQMRYFPVSWDDIARKKQKEYQAKSNQAFFNAHKRTQELEDWRGKGAVCNVTLLKQYDHPRYWYYELVYKNDLSLLAYSNLSTCIPRRSPPWSSRSRHGRPQLSPASQLWIWAESLPSGLALAPVTKRTTIIIVFYRGQLLKQDLFIHSLLCCMPL